MAIGVSYEGHNSIIPTLEDLAFDVFFKEFVCKSTPNSTEVIRDWIDRQLVGRVGRTVREKCVREWNDALEFKKERKTMNRYTNMDQRLFMDCILNPSFVKLKINIYFSSYEYFYFHLFIIGQRCPKLRDLVITLHKPDAGTRNKLDFSSFKQFKDHQRHLSCLTSLTIDGGDLIQLTHHDDDDKNYQSIFGIIGKFCPSLSRLSIYNICIWKKDILALLIVGEMTDILFPDNKDGWSTNSVLETLQIPSEFWNPLCFTLQELSFDCTNNIGIMEYDNCILHSLKDAYLMTAFALRYLPKLQIFDIKKDHNLILSNVTAVKILSDVHMSRKNNAAQPGEKASTSTWKWIRKKLLRIGKKPRPKIEMNCKELVAAKRS